MRNFRELRVWERAHQTASSIYRGTRAFPREELYGLTSQIRRAASSIGANIAEVCGRRSDPELARFLKIAMGSATELECHLLLAHDLGFLEGAAHCSFEAQLTEVKAMLASLLQKAEGERGSNSGVNAPSKSLKIRAVGVKA